MYKLITNNYPYYQFKKSTNESKGTILFIHGYATNSDYHNWFSDQVNDYDYIAIELAGHGITPLKNKKQLSPMSYTQEIINLIKMLKLKDIYLIGHSMGGGIAVLISQSIPELIKKMVIVTPMNSWAVDNVFKFFLKFNPKNHRQLSTFYNIIMYDYEKNKCRLSHNEKENLIKMHNKHRKEFRYLKYQLASIKNLITLSKNEWDLKIPTLLIVGVGDSCINHKLTLKNFTKKNKNNPNLKTYTFEESGHIPFFEQPKLYYDVIMDFFTNK